MDHNTSSDQMKVLLRTASRCAALAALTLGGGWVAPVFGQATPNWGTDTSQTHTGSSATANQSPWGSGATPPPPRPQPAKRGAAEVELIPPQLAEILKRPDNDRITLPSGEVKSVQEIRAHTYARRAVVEALKTGKVPAGRTRVRLATARSPQHDELLNASKSIRDSARRDAAAAWAGKLAIAEEQASQGNPAAGAAWTAPSTQSGVPRTQSAAPIGQGGAKTAWAAPAGNSQGDPAAAWAQPASGMRSKQHQAQAAALAPLAASEPHSGIGSATMSQSGPASLGLGTSKSGSAQRSSQPSLDFMAQNLPPGIELVNGRSKGVLFTPGGLYTIIGSGFGNAVGAVDLVDPHLPGGRLALQVTQWDERKLQAQLPEPVSGIADQGVTLRVTTRTGTLYTKDVQFYATRQAITINSNDLDLNQLFDVNLGNQNDWSATAIPGGIERTTSGNNIDCPSVGQDSLRTKLPTGWALTEVAISTWLPTQSDQKKDFFGEDGDIVVSGGYSITQIPAGITNQTYAVNWGVLRSHSTNGFTLFQKFGGNDFAWSGNDGCVSEYGIDVTLVGPAGVRPF